ncbi:MAG: SH3 domain-containing protein, partial [Chloroflexaceae bacterium]
GSSARCRLRAPGCLHFASLVMALLPLLLGACGDPAAVLPARPTPVPTLARLPSVTPVPPTPSLLALPPTALPALATPEPLLARVAVVANLRAGPGTEHAVLDVFEAGVPVRLLGRLGAWYQVQGPGERRGWMAAEVLEIDPATAGAVPEISP